MQEPFLLLYRSSLFFYRMRESSGEFLFVLGPTDQSRTSSSMWILYYHLGTSPKWDVSVSVLDFWTTPSKMGGEGNGRFVVLSSAWDICSAKIKACTSWEFFYFSKIFILDFRNTEVSRASGHLLGILRKIFLEIMLGSFSFRTLLIQENASLKRLRKKNLKELR